MAKEQIPFEDFLMDAGSHGPFVMDIHQLMSDAGCVCEIKSAKNGLVVSYLHSKRTVLNYVFRKKGLLLRLYGDNYHAYKELFDSLPDSMKKEMKSASQCRRLINPDQCNSRCSMGYDYLLDGELQQKCRYSAFQFLIRDENNGQIRDLVEREIEGRTAGTI